MTQGLDVTPSSLSHHFDRYVDPGSHPSSALLRPPSRSGISTVIVWRKVWWCNMSSTTLVVPGSVPKSSQSEVPISSIRRKPKVTYRSPSAHTPVTLRIEGPAKLVPCPSSSSSSSPPPPFSKPHTTNIALHALSTDRIKGKKYMMGPPLPLYHPLGRLALSLPELDPTTLGLPAPLRMDESRRRASARARRPAAKLRDADGEHEGGSGVAVGLGAGVGVDVRSPKKKKSGGGGKRKRKEGDDGDGAYPAKKGRGDVSLGVDAVVAEEKEGRSTRSRKRRDSSGSDGTSTVTRSAHES